MSAANGPSCTCTSRAVISERTHDPECHRRLWIEAEDRADAAELDAENCTKLLMVALGERNAALAEGERLREALRQARACMEWCVNLGADEQTAKSLRRGIAVIDAGPLCRPVGQHAGGHVSDDLDQAMQDVLLAMTMLSNGTTQAWDKSGSQGKPGSRILVLVEKPIADVYRERWENANGPTSRRAILEEARRELDQWRGWLRRDVPAGETPEQEERRLLQEGKGFDPNAVAQRFRTSATRVRRLRRAAGLNEETGAGHVVSAPDDSPERIRELAAQGMSVRAIAMLTRASKSTVDRVVRRAA